MTDKEIAQKCRDIWKDYQAKKITLAVLTGECQKLYIPDEVREVKNQFRGDVVERGCPF